MTSTIEMYLESSIIAEENSCFQKLLGRGKLKKDKCNLKKTKNVRVGRTKYLKLETGEKDI